MGSLCLLAALALPVFLPIEATPQIGAPRTTALSPVEEDARPHVHEIVIDLGRTRARHVRVVVELSGARRPAKVSRRFAAGAMSVAAGLIGGPAAGAIPSLADSMTDDLRGSGDTVFAVRGRRLRSLGGGLFVLRFQCVHDPPPTGGEGGGAAVRVSVRARGAAGDLKLAGAWQPLAGPSALSSSRFPED